MQPDLRRKIKGLVTGMLPWPLFLYGLAGRGKTCAALTLADRVPGAVFKTVEDLVQLVLRGNEGYGLWQALKESPLVVIDELGLRSQQGDLEYVAVKRVADLREFRPAVWISNQTPQALIQVYDERIYSRICCGTCVELKGKDRRFA